MNNRPLRGNIRPKLSNIPRRASEASTCLELYKLAVEKARLEEELAAIAARQQQIDLRLTQIARQRQQLQQLGEVGPADQPQDAPDSQQPPRSGSFKTFAVEY